MGEKRLNHLLVCPFVLCCLFLMPNFKFLGTVVFKISLTRNICYSDKYPSKHVYMGPIWAESGHLSHSGHAWAPYRLFCPYKTYIGPILVNFDQQTRIYGNHMGRFGAFIPFGSYLGPYRLFCPYKTLIGPILVKFDNYKNTF